MSPDPDRLNLRHWQASLREGDPVRIRWNGEILSGVVARLGPLSIRARVTAGPLAGTVVRVPRGDLTFGVLPPETL